MPPAGGARLYAERVFAAADVPTWVGVPTGIAGLVIPLTLWLSRRVMLRSDHDEDVARREREWERERREHRERVANLTADRDAWRVAHREEARAVVEAQRATAALMETGSISRDLLAALRDAVGRG